MNRAQPQLWAQLGEARAPLHLTHGRIEQRHRTAHIDDANAAVSLIAQCFLSAGRHGANLLNWNGQEEVLLGSQPADHEA